MIWDPSQKKTHALKLNPNRNHNILVLVLKGHFNANFNYNLVFDSDMLLYYWRDYPDDDLIDQFISSITAHLSKSIISP